MKTYDLNTNNARAAGMSTRITEKGAYIGKFTRAQAITAKSGAEGIEFSFESDDGQRADYLSIWTTNRDGKELYGRKVLDAIMTCMKARSISAEPTPFKRNDGQTEMVPQFRALLGRVGVFLVSEQYEKDDGSVASKMALVLPFEADTKRTAAEVLDKASAGSFDRILASLRDKPLQAKTSQRRAAAAQHTNTGGGFDDMDDDIPF
ncbi:MAG: hypothetical protein LW768_22125 [Rubrivivax sp.]|nr:hypothetical protein [Rubrivivax sp.]